MSWLLIDNSNTRTKLALGDASGIHGWRRVIPTAGICPGALDAGLEGVEYSAVVLSSVVPSRAAVIAEYFRSRCAMHHLSHESPLGMSIDYPNPGQLGADRLANACGALGRYGAPLLVIDFGTAVTFDVVSAGPVYLGGVIAPGLGVVSAYLPERTALLPAIVLDEPASAIGKSTVEAMQAGAVFGYRGLVREIIGRIRVELPGEMRIVATGGDAGEIARGLPEITVVDPDITLEGLRLVASRLFS